MRQLRVVKIIVLMVTTLFIVGCSGIERKPMDYPKPPTEKIPEGPGIFTGDDGAIIIKK